MNEKRDNFLAKMLSEMPEEGVSKFQPMACYNPDGDCVEFHLTNESFFAKRMDGWFTAYLGEQSGELVGGMVKGVRTSLLERFPGLNIDVEGGRVKLAFILRAAAYAADDEVARRTYKTAIKGVERADLSAELDLVGA